MNTYYLEYHHNGHLYISSDNPYDDRAEVIKSYNWCKLIPVKHYPLKDEPNLFCCNNRTWYKGEANSIKEFLDRFNKLLECDHLEVK